jgi:hypothetical protein
MPRSEDGRDGLIVAFLEIFFHFFFHLLQVRLDPGNVICFIVPVTTFIHHFINTN